MNATGTTPVTNTRNTPPKIETGYFCVSKSTCVSMDVSDEDFTNQKDAQLSISRMHTMIPPPHRMNIASRSQSAAFQTTPLRLLPAAIKSAPKIVSHRPT